MPIKRNNPYAAEFEVVQQIERMLRPLKWFYIITTGICFLWVMFVIGHVLIYPSDSGRVIAVQFIALLTGNGGILVSGGYFQRRSAWIERFIREAYLVRQNTSDTRGADVDE